MLLRRLRYKSQEAAAGGGNDGKSIAELQRHPERIVAVLNSAAHRLPSPELLHSAVIAEHVLQSIQSQWPELRPASFADANHDTTPTDAEGVPKLAMDASDHKAVDAEAAARGAASARQPQQ